jgi:hypothetical protein
MRPRGAAYRPDAVLSRWHKLRATLVLRTLLRLRLHVRHFFASQATDYYVRERGRTRATGGAGVVAAHRFTAPLSHLGGYTMKRLAFLAVVACFCGCVVTDGRAGMITYDIQNYPTQQGGHTLSGQITTDGTIGALTASEIHSWTWTIDAGTTHAFTVSGTGADVTILGDVEASPTQITLAQPAAPPTGSSENELILSGATSNVDLKWERLTLDTGPGTFEDANLYLAANGNTLWDTQPEPFLPSIFSPWVLAEATPEPASLTLLGLGVAGIAAYRWRRRR